MYAGGLRSAIWGVPYPWSEKTADFLKPLRSETGEIFWPTSHGEARHAAVEIQPYSSQKRIVISMERAITPT